MRSLVLAVGLSRATPSNLFWIGDETQVTITKGNTPC